MSLPQTVPTESLLAEGAWLRRLARRLVQDEAHAEDLVQDTLVAALEREEAGRVPGRPWLAGVLRNVARLRARAGARRGAREAQQGRDDAPAADEVVARIEAQRRLAEAVLALEEPWRTTVALRFFEGLPPREVARRMGVPVRTVHTRSERALLLLKERLDRSFGRRGAWCAALTDLARGGLALPLGLGTLGGAAMGAAIKWGSAAAVLVAGGILVQSRLSDSGTPASPAPVAAPLERPVAALDAPHAPESAPGAEAPRTAVASAAPSAAAPAPAAPQPPATFAGRVVDGAGRPVAGVLVVFERPPNRHAPPHVHAAETLDGRSATSGPDGTFHLPVQERIGRLSVVDERWACIASVGLAWMPPLEPPVVVVGPRRAYGGVVVDAEGQPVADVDLCFQAPGGGEGDLAPTATSDAEGRFRCDTVGFTQGLQLLVRSFVYRSTAQDLPPADALELVVVVERQLADGVLAGRVVDARGAGVPGAYVSAGTVALKTDAGGSFTLDPGMIPTTVGSAEEIVAVHAGFQPARRSLAGLSSEQRQSLVLELVDASLSIAGRVLDAQGEPVPEAFVWTFETTPFGVVPVEIERNSWHGFPASLEGLAAGNAWGDLQKTADAEGRFELGGLLPRTYALYAMDPATLGAAGPVEAGAGERSLVLRLRGDGRVGPVAGRVTNLAGAPLAGIHVDLYRRVEHPTGPRNPPNDFHARAETGEDGAFRFPRVAQERCHLVLRSADGPWVRVELEHEAHPEDLRLVLPEVRYLRLALRADCPAGTLWAIEDGGGERLETTATSGMTRVVSMQHSLACDLVATDERARFLVLYLGDGEVRRIPLALQRGEVTAIQL